MCAVCSALRSGLWCAEAGLNKGHMLNGKWQSVASWSCKAYSELILIRSCNTRKSVKIGKAKVNISV